MLSNSYDLFGNNYWKQSETGQKLWQHKWISWWAVYSYPGLTVLFLQSVFIKMNNFPGNPLQEIT